MSDIEDLKNDMQEVMRNHLPHIQKTLTKHNERLKLVLWILGIVGTIVIADFIKAF